MLDIEEWVSNKEVDTIVNNVSVPTLTVFLPSRQLSNGTAVIICPGGGYHTLLIKREGSKVAKAFNKAGITAFVLKYRLPSDRTMVDKSIGSIQDAQQAIKLVRERALEWNINPDRIGIMGFSAGGHLAAMAGTHFDYNFIKNNKATSLRPDFMLLIYPVISFTDSIGHIGSRENLLGTSPTESQIKYFSNELQVTQKTPPAFLTHATGDIVVSSKNSLYFYQALHKTGVPAELHLYEKGEHGFLTAPPFEEWFGRCIYWMKANGWIF
ncbi:MAG: alpha/beta hydrolase [Ginsengibacter sp.]